MKFKSGDKIIWFKQTHPATKTPAIYVDETKTKSKVRIRIQEKDGSHRTVMTTLDFIEHESTDPHPHVTIPLGGFKF